MPSDAEMNNYFKKQSEKHAAPVEDNKPGGTGSAIVTPDGTAEYDENGNLMTLKPSTSYSPSVTKEEYEEQQEKKNNELSKAPDSVTKRMESLNTMINNVTKKINTNRAIYTMYVDFQVKIGGKWTPLCNSTSKNWISNCLIMLKNKISGAGGANTFELQIMFKQNDRNIQNIDILEAQLLSTCAIITTDGKDIIDADIAAFNCKFQYGYGDDSNLRSPWYTGRIMDYHCDLNNGNLKYTITGFAGIYGLKEIRITTKSEYKVEETSSPLKYIENIFNAEFGEGSKYEGLYKLEMLVDNAEDVINPDPEFKQFTNKNLFEVLKDILAGTAIQEQTDHLKNGETYNPASQVLFGYYLDSAQADGDTFAGTVYIYKTPSTYDKNCDLKPQSDITFNYFGPGSSGVNHLVKSWNPQYDGSILLNLAAAIKMTDQKFQTMDTEGNIIDVIGMGAARLGLLDDSSSIFNTIQEYSKWSAATQYCYNASMTTMGIPCEAPITGLMQINVMMVSSHEVGYKHHSSGIYMITGKTDTISNSGFYTDFELFKMTKVVPDSVKKILDDKTDEGQDDKSVEDNKPGGVGSALVTPDGTAEYDENGNLITLKPGTSYSPSQTQQEIEDNNFQRHRAETMEHYATNDDNTSLIDLIKMIWKYYNGE